MLPRYIEAIRPQTKSAFSTKSSGPGCRPQIRRPPSSTAAVGEPGTPSVSIGSSAEVPAACAAVSGRDHALDLAGAELLAVARHALGHAVAHERGRRRPARDDAHRGSRPTELRSDVFQYFGSSFQVSSTTRTLSLRARALEHQPLLDGEQDLADAEEADHRDQEVEALQQLHVAEGEAQLPGHGVDADRGEREAQHHRRDGLEGRALGHADEGAEGEQVDREELRRPELAARSARRAATGT